jgi:hypothetical protein
MYGLSTARSIRTQLANVAKYNAFVLGLDVSLIPGPIDTLPLDDARAELKRRQKPWHQEHFERYLKACANRLDVEYPEPEN